MIASTADLVGAVSAITRYVGWGDGLLLAVMLFVIQGAGRRLLAVAAVLLFTAAFPPLSWPTVWFGFTPLVWIWREKVRKRSMAWDILEAVAIGFTMVWFSTGFVRDAVPVWGVVVQADACLVFSLHVVGIAMAVRVVRDWAVPAAAVLSTVVAVAGELLEARLGIAWSVSNLSLTAADTPVAQWSAMVTPFGVSGILNLVNFLFVWDKSPRFWLRWAGPISGFVIAVSTWFGGSLLASATRVESMPFSVMLVQLRTAS